MNRKKLEQVVRKALKAGLSEKMSCAVIEETRRSGVVAYHVLKNHNHPDNDHGIYYWTLWGWLCELENFFSETDIRATAGYWLGMKDLPSEVIKIKS